jgi:hypothetical protein
MRTVVRLIMIVATMVLLATAIEYGLITTSTSTSVAEGTPMPALR